jgi:hypothetical protein
MRIVRLAAPSSLAVIGTLLFCSGIGWLVVLHYENRLDPEAAKLITNDWTPPWTLRVFVCVGFMLLILGWRRQSLQIPVQTATPLIRIPTCVTWLANNRDYTS